MSKLVGYLRVSTEGQADEGVSLSAQREKLTMYAKAMDIELVDIIEDAGQSAKTLNRPGLARALEMCRSGEADGILATKLDRITRSLGDLVALVDSGVKLVAIHDNIDTKSAAGRLVTHILAAVSQWEREAIAERTKEALAEVKRQGRKLGNVPFGKDQEEAAAIERIMALHAASSSCSAIASTLTAEGLKTRRGPWTKQKVSRIVRAQTQAS